MMANGFSESKQEEHKMKKSLLITIVSVVLIAAIAGVASSLSRSKSEGSLTVKRGDLLEAAYGVGTVKADKSFTLKTAVSTRMIKRYVNAGDRVKKGAPLVQLDGLPVYLAPFDGMVGVVSYNEGEIVFAQTPVVNLVNLQTLYLQLSLDERTVSGILNGQIAKISFEGQRRKTLQGIVRAVFSSESEFLIDIDFDQKGLTLLPGMTADVAVEISSYKNQLLVPVAALKIDKVMVAQSSHINTPVQVKVLADDGKFAVIESEVLHEGDVLVSQKVEPAGGFGGRH